MANIGYLWIGLSFACILTALILSARNVANRHDCQLEPHAENPPQPEQYHSGGVSELGMLWVAHLSTIGLDRFEIEEWVNCTIRVARQN